jgi:hypothetical protein
MLQPLTEASAWEPMQKPDFYLLRPAPFGDRIGVFMLTLPTKCALRYDGVTYPPGASYLETEDGDFVRLLDGAEYEIRLADGGTVRARREP